MLKEKKNFLGIACICALIYFLIPVSIKANETVTVTGGESRETATEIEWGNTYTTTNADGWFKVYAEWDMHYIGAGYDELSNVYAYKPDGNALSRNNYRRYGVRLGEQTYYWGSFDDIPGNNFYYFNVKSTKSESCTFMLMPSLANTKANRELIQFNETYEDVFFETESSCYQFVAANTGNYKIITITNEGKDTSSSFAISYKDGSSIVSERIDSNTATEVTFPVKQGVTYYLSIGVSLSKWINAPVRTLFMVSNAKLSSITLNETNLSMKAGEQKQLQASVSPVTAVDRSISFTTLNPNVAIVTEDGIVTAVGDGNTVIRATANDGSGVYADCQVSVASAQTGNPTNPVNPTNPANSGNTNYSAGTQIKVGMEKTVGKLKYKVTSVSNRTVNVVGVSSRSQKSYSVPATVTIGGYRYKVTGIAAKAFAKCTKATKVTLGANIKTIGKQAFYNCKKLKALTIKSKQIKSVGKNALKNVNKKAKIKVPGSSYKKYSKLFKGKGLKSVTLKKK